MEESKSLIDLQQFSVQWINKYYRTVIINCLQYHKMIRVVLITLLLQTILCQPKCTSSGIPRQFPLLAEQHLLIDLNNYFQGPNLTLSLKSSSPYVGLQKKYETNEQKHVLGNILSIASANNIISLLGVTSTGRFYIYYAPLSNPNSLTAKEVPMTLSSCTNHALSPDASSVAVTCQIQSKNMTKYAVGYSKLSQKEVWQIQVSKKLANCSGRQVQYLDNERIVVIVQNQSNSYIQLWDSLNGRVMGVFDRAFLSLPSLNITDLQTQSGSLFILDYETGIYQLRLNFQTLVIEQQLQFIHFTKLAVSMDSFLVAKKGSVTEYGGKSTFKYESIGSGTVRQLAISQQYIIIYTQAQIITYLRGYHTPYFTLPLSSALHKYVTGIFVNNSRVLQTFSIQGQLQVIFKEIILLHPYLQVPENVPTSTQVTVTAVSTVESLEERCNISFVLIRTKQQEMEIFQNEYTRNGTEHIYMNRPSRSELDLTPYGMGPDLYYQIEKFSQNINLTYQVRKTSRIQNLSIEGIDKIVVKGIYFSDTCGLYKTQCPLVIDSVTQSMMRFYQCLIVTDFYLKVQRLQCTEKFKQFKFGQYLHYQLEQSLLQYQYFYEISVLVNAPSEISIRKFQITNFFNPVMTFKYKINGSNTFGQNAITQLDFDEDSRMLYVLLAKRKEIQIFVLNQQQNQLSLKVFCVINSQLLKKMFNPGSFEVDSDSMLWVKNLDHLIVFDLRKVDKGGKPEVLSTINIDFKLVKSYDYIFEVVERRKSSQVFGPENLQYSQQKRIKYLVIFNGIDVLLKCTISHLYEVDQKQIQPLPRYGYIIPQKSSNKILQSLGNSQLMVSLTNGFGQTKMNVIYDLDSVSLVSAYYAGIQTKLVAMPAFFYLSSSSPVVIFLESNPTSSQIIAYQIEEKPKVILSVNQMVGQTQQQNIIMKVFNKKDSLRHTIVLGIANTPENMTKGEKYPYPNVRAEAADRYIEIDTKGWVAGNVLKITYSCKDCRIPTNKQQSYIDVKGKMWEKADMQLAGGNQFEIVGRGQSSSVVIMQKNMLYTFDTYENRITNLHQITQFSSDTILAFKVSYAHRLIVAVVQDENYVSSLVTFSTATFKGFQLSRMTLPSTINYIMNLEYKGDVIALVDFYAVYIVSVDSLGHTNVVDYINEIEAGGSVCWAELLPPTGNQTFYTLVITLCDSGITYITFTLEDNLSILKITNKQTLDLKSRLNEINIRMPTDATFRRTVTTPSSDGQSLSIYTIIRNFNTFQWILKLNNKIIISDAKVEKVIHRYGDFGATQDVSLDGSGRFMLITYFGLFDASYQYIHAVYDLQDVHPGPNNQPYSNCFIMSALESPVNKRPQFLTNNTLIVLSNDAHHIKRIDVDNKFRAVIHNENNLYSQSVFMIPFTPVSSINIEIIIRGINVVVMQTWQIFLIVVFSLLAIGVVIFFFRVFLRKYKQKMKLVPLLVDYAQYEQDLAEQVEKKIRNSRGPEDRESLITTERGSVNI